MKHPYVEGAEILEDLLRLQRKHDNEHTGVSVFSSTDSEDRARREAIRLRYLASIDLNFSCEEELYDGNR
jgi:hypothetical protein